MSTWAPLGASCEFHSRRGQAGSTGYARMRARYRGGLLFGDFSLGRTRESHRRPDVTWTTYLFASVGRFCHPHYSWPSAEPRCADSDGFVSYVGGRPRVHTTSYPHLVISTPPHIHATPPEVELVTKFAGGCERKEAGLVERAKAILGTLEPSRVDLHESAVLTEMGD